jgi:regulator of sigma E protease
VIGSVDDESIASLSGLSNGMEIKKVDGRDTPDWQSVNLELVSHIGDPTIAIEVLLPDASQSIKKELNTGQWKFDPDKASPLKSLGIIPYRPQIRTELSSVERNSPAEQAGLIIGDKIVGIDGTKMDNWGQIVTYIAKRPNIELEFLVNRNGQGITLYATTGEKITGSDKIGYMGVSPVVPAWPEDYVFTHQYNAVESVLRGMRETWRLMTLSFQMIGKIFTGDVSVKSLSGPISIAQGAGASASFGFVYFLSFLALISVNLGIVNLLPLPVLDGGHLMFYTIEMIMGRPVPEHYQDVGFRIGGALLFAIMAVAIFNDIARL